MTENNSKIISNPKISIGLPVYNGENILRRSIDSILSQTFSDFELIISDNASSDSTPIICQDYAKRDKRIRYVRQKKNIGVYRNYFFIKRPKDRTSISHFFSSVHFYILL